MISHTVPPVNAPSHEGSDLIGLGDAYEGDAGEDWRRLAESEILEGIPPLVGPDDRARLCAAIPGLKEKLADPGLSCWGSCAPEKPCGNCLVVRRYFALELFREKHGKPLHPKDAAFGVDVEPWDSEDDRRTRVEARILRFLNVREADLADYLLRLMAGPIADIVLAVLDEERSMA